LADLIYFEVVPFSFVIINMLKKRGGEKLPLNRIKKIMQANKEIGKIQSTTPQLIAWALEGFIEDITKKAAELCVIN